MARHLIRFSRANRAAVPGTRTGFPTRDEVIQRRKEREKAQHRKDLETLEAELVAYSEEHRDVQDRMVAEEKLLMVACVLPSLKRAFRKGYDP